MAKLITSSSMTAGILAWLSQALLRVSDAWPDLGVAPQSGVLRVGVL